MVQTTVKTIGTTGVFSTPQLWEDGAPVDLTTSNHWTAGTFLVAAFIQGEVVTGTGVTGGKMLDTDSTGAGTGTYITFGTTTTPLVGATLTGSTSGATCVLTGSANVGVIWEGQCQNQEFTAAGTVLTVTGSTASAAAYKKITTVAGASFRDNANVQTNALRYAASNGAAFKTTTTADAHTANFTEAYCQSHNLQLTCDQISQRCIGSTGADQRHEGLLMEGRYFFSSEYAGCAFFAGSATKIINTLIIQLTGSASNIVATNTGTPEFYNCTIVCPDDIVSPTWIFQSGASGSITVKNCGLFAGDSTKAIKTGSATLTATTCHSDIAGTAGVTQVTYSSQFENVNSATRDFRLKTGAGMIDSGTTDATNAPVDIAGTARPSGASYDTGCWEKVQAGGGADVRNHIIPAYMRFSA